MRIISAKTGMTSDQCMKITHIEMLKGIRLVQSLQNKVDQPEGLPDGPGRHCVVIVAVVIHLDPTEVSLQQTIAYSCPWPYESHKVPCEITFAAANAMRGFRRVCSSGALGVAAGERVTWSASV